MRIHRSNPDSNFLMLPNATAQDGRLSWMARGLLIELVSRPIDWEANADLLSDQATAQRGEKVGEGRRAVRAAFAELEEYGYIVRSRVRVERGRFTTVIDVYDTPDHHRGTAGGTSVGGTSADGTSVTGTSLQRTDTQRTELQSTDDKDCSTLADARVGALASAANQVQSAWDIVDETRRAEQLRDRLIYGDDEAAKKANQLAGVLNLSNLEECNRHLGEHYKAVDRLSSDQLRDALLVLERKRKRIFRACRERAFDQYDEKDRQILAGTAANRMADRLSYKFALAHYYNSPRGIPPWLLKPLLRSDNRAA